MPYFEYWQQMPGLQSDLRQVQAIIRQNLKNVQGKLGAALRYNFAVPGKELRPAFVLLFGQMGGKGKAKRMLRLASSIEILHNATLIHDDIIDEAAIRRGRPSIQAKYGKHIALYAGDFLFALSLQLLSNNTAKITNLRVDSRSMQEILAGETRQYGNEYKINISKEDYLKQIRGKTAILFGYSCFLGAIEGGLSYSLARKAETFGEKVGLSFQLRDDILDYQKSPQDPQKPVLNDVLSGVYTGPLIFALQKDAKHQLLPLLRKKKKLSPADLQQIDTLVVKLGGLRATQSLADNYTAQALQLLDQYFKPYQPWAHLRQLVTKLRKRDY